jgi:hypothetical protein
MVGLSENAASLVGMLSLAGDEESAAFFAPVGLAPSAFASFAAV